MDDSSRRSVGGVVSLVPSITESVLAWHVDVVACTRFCEQPTLRHVGGTKNPDIDAIVDLSPRVVLMDTEENRREDADELVRRGIQVVATEVHRLADVGPALAAIARAVGVDPPPFTDAAPVPGVSSRRRAVVPIWRRPWMVLGADTYGSSLLGALGIDVVAPDDARYPSVELEHLAAGGPDAHVDLVLVPSEPYGFTDTHVAELEQVFPESGVRRVDGRDLFWWGVRTSRALEHLAEELS